MDFVDQLKQFAKRVESMKDSLQTEEVICGIINRK